MLSKMLLATALLGAAFFGPVSALQTVDDIVNPSFENTYTNPNHNYLLPAGWSQWGLGSDANPTVVSTNTRAHTGSRSAQFLPRSVTGLGQTATYEAEIYQEVQILERGQRLMLEYWVFFGGVPLGVDPSTSGQYRFVVSYDHDTHASVEITPQFVTGTGTAADNFFYQFTAEWDAPEQHDGHDSAYVTLRFTTEQTNIYVYLDDIRLWSPADLGGVVGDPQFVGLRGQSYQVHGIDGAVYNLVSSPSTQVNAQFTFLEQGKCPVFDGIPDTNCWAHPGSYLGSIGIQEVVNGKLHQVELVSGSATQGFASITVDGQSVAIRQSIADTDDFSVERVSSHRVIARTSQFTFTFDNSDMFINQAVSTHVPMSSLTCHGLLGQTHQRKVYASAVKYIAGDVDDYMIQENTLFGKEFVYNQFEL
jgi:hypothetical protein